MIFEMRFQILALAASLTTSMLAGYLFAVPPIENPASSDRFAVASDSSQGSPTIFTDFGNELAWEETPDRCVSAPRDAARAGNGLLGSLIHRVSEDGRPEAAGSPGTACPAR